MRKGARKKRCHHCKALTHGRWCPHCGRKKCSRKDFAEGRGSDSVNHDRIHKHRRYSAPSYGSGYGYGSSSFWG